MRARWTTPLWLVAAIATASADGAFALSGPTPNEVVIELANSVSEEQALQRRLRLTRIESQMVRLSNSTFYRWRVPDNRSVAGIVRALQGNRFVASAQPNYRFALQGKEDVDGRATDTLASAVPCCQL